MVLDGVPVVIRALIGIAEAARKAAVAALLAFLIYEIVVKYGGFCIWLKEIF